MRFNASGASGPSLNYVISYARSLAYWPDGHETFGAVDVVAERAGEATVLFEVKGKQEKFYKKERS
jgi:hypothetical protein